MRPIGGERWPSDPPPRARTTAAGIGARAGFGRGALAGARPIGTTASVGPTSRSGNCVKSYH